MNCMIHKYFISICRNNINFDTYRKINTVFTSCNDVLTTHVFMTKFSSQLYHKNSLHTTKVRFKEIKSNLKLFENQNNYSSVQLKKRPKKRKSLSTNEEINTSYRMKALATSEEYNLESLVEGLIEQNLYIPSSINTSTNFLFIYKFSTSDPNIIYR